MTTVYQSRNIIKEYIHLRLHLNFTKMVTNFLSLMCAWSYAKNIKYFLFIPQDKYYYPHFQNEGTEGQRIQVIHSKSYSLKRSCQNLNTIIDPKSIHFIVSTKYQQQLSSVERLPGKTFYNSDVIQCANDLELKDQDLNALRQVIYFPESEFPWSY